MAQVTYVEANGTARSVDIVAGLSVADGALLFKIPGIEADCGGHCACATCHVYVDEPWASHLTPPDEFEQNMLGFAFDVRANSRLGCQIKISDKLDGLSIQTPARQY